jgi:hypothetical protein
MVVENIFVFKMHNAACGVVKFYSSGLVTHDWLQEPILRLQNLLLQRQRCSRLERFCIGEKYLLF